jgi:hypothetical protein
LKTCHPILRFSRLHLGLMHAGLDLGHAAIHK